MKGDPGIKASEVGKIVSEYEVHYRTCKIWTWLVQGIKKEKQKNKQDCMYFKT